MAQAVRPDGSPMYNVAIIDLPSEQGMARIASLNRAVLPFGNTDRELDRALRNAVARQNLHATVDPEFYRSAAVAIVDVNLDVNLRTQPPSVDFSGFKAAIRILGDRLPAGALILVETTVPPGTCERIVAPIIEESLRQRRLGAQDLLISHSYERVMPGAGYLASIREFWRVYAGRDERAAAACEAFLTSLIDTKRFPLTRVVSTTASELGKVLENSYRATNIAFIEEWSRFAEKIGVDIFPVIDAIRIRPTHANLRQPGFGVGGYCLTKDPMFGGIAARELFQQEQAFPFSELAVAVNEAMPLQTLRLLKEAWNGSVAGRRILLLGVSYRPDVGDTRYSPSEKFVRASQEGGAVVDCYDPLVSAWPELGVNLPATLPAVKGYDAVVFASAHPDFVQLDLESWLGDTRPLVVDANRVLSAWQLATIRRTGLRFSSIGRGGNL